MASYFRDPAELSPLGGGMAAIITSLNLGRSGKHGTVSVRASRAGYAILLNGKALAKGSTGNDLQRAFDAEVSSARTGTRTVPTSKKNQRGS
jgi:hypothetical protein